MKRAVFLDRDGTLIHDPGYLSKVEQIEFYPGVIELLAKLKKQGVLLFIITNQSGVGRGYFTESQLNDVHDALRETMQQAGAGIDGLRYCPHAPAQQCPHRKPSPDMVFELAGEYDVDLSKSVFVGDKLQDVHTGRNAGCATALIRHNKTDKQLTAQCPEGWTDPDYCAHTPQEALQWALDYLTEQSPQQGDVTYDR